MIWVQCPHCRLAQGSDDALANGRQQCIACGKAFRLPGVAVTPPAESPVPLEGAAEAYTVHLSPRAGERRASPETYGIRSAPEPAPERRKRTRRRSRLAPTAGPRTFAECWRRHPARKGLGVFLLFIPLFLEGFFPGIPPLAVVLPFSLIGGIAAGLLFAPDLRRLPVGLVPGLLAGILTPLALHFYIVCTPPQYAIYAKELAVVWAMSLVVPAGLYCVLLWLTLPRDRHPDPVGPRHAPVTFRSRATIWGVLVGSGFFFLFGFGCLPLAFHEPPIPRKILFFFMGACWMAVGLLIVFAGFFRGRLGASPRRVGRGRD